MADISHIPLMGEMANSGKVSAQPLVALRYVDHRGNATETYPLNPNGSPQGITGLTTPGVAFFVGSWSELTPLLLCDRR